MPDIPIIHNLISDGHNHRDDRNVHNRCLHSDRNDRIRMESNGVQLGCHDAQCHDGGVRQIQRIMVCQSLMKSLGQ